MEINKETKTITMSKIYDAPRDLVWNVSTDKNLIPEWWGPSQYTTKVVEMDMRAGGKWRFVQTDKDGKEEAFRGEYKEVNAPESFTWTFEWEGMPGHILTETYKYEATEDNKTKVTSYTVFDTLEDLEGMVATGMEGGATETMERLGKLLESKK